MLIYSFFTWIHINLETEVAEDGPQGRTQCSAPVDKAEVGGRRVLGHIVVHVGNSEGMKKRTSNSGYEKSYEDCSHAQWISYCFPRALK